MKYQLFEAVWALRLIVVPLIAVQCLANGCGRNTYFSLVPQSPLTLNVGQGPDSSGGVQLPFPTNNPGPYVCDPFGGNGPVGPHNGLKADLTYIPASSPLVSSLNALTVATFQPGAPDVVLEPTPVILSQLNVPTEGFAQGFRDSGGHQLTDLAGNILVEFFSLRTSAQLMLNAADPEGDYQFAILSDDGSVLSVDASGNGTYQEIIDNDGRHANELGCSSSAVHLRPGAPLPFQLNYFQGPRWQIALILLWRRVTSATPPEPGCGLVESETYYFDQSTGTPQPAAGFQALESRGWQVVPSANFYLPNGLTNPCATH